MLQHNLHTDLSITLLSAKVLPLGPLKKVVKFCKTYKHILEQILKLKKPQLEP